MLYRKEKDNASYDTYQERQQQMDYNERVAEHNRRVQQQENDEAFKEMHGSRFGERAPGGGNGEFSAFAEKFFMYLLYGVIILLAPFIVIASNVAAVLILTSVTYSFFFYDTPPGIWLVACAILFYLPAIKLVRDDLNPQSNPFLKIWSMIVSIARVLAFYALVIYVIGLIYVFFIGDIGDIAELLPAIYI